MVLEPRSQTSEGWDGTDAQMGMMSNFSKMVHGVSSVGMVPNNMRALLGKVAAAGKVGFPRITVSVANPYESKPGENPREKLSAVLNVWRGLGFKKLIPILEAFTGEDNLRELIDECDRLGLDYILSSLQVIEGLGINCSIDDRE
ncbi:hypothetical protein [Nannocystis pusilla]|uniref:hypothetical protein n=1 Tax=Nannocystis pusilla TaxID=889268 RepID=UPI003B7C9FC1